MKNFNFNESIDYLRYPESSLFDELFSNDMVMVIPGIELIWPEDLIQKVIEW